MTELAVQAQALIRRVDADRYDWPRHARPSQREPRDYLVHAIVAGRGSGKTRTGAETVRRWAKRRVGTYAVIAKNDREVRRICFEAPRAGLLAVIPPRMWPATRKDPERPS
jgi:phage terminase large subunit-like protein